MSNVMEQQNQQQSNQQLVQISLDEARRERSKRIKIFFLVALAAVVVSVAGILLLRAMNPSAPQPQTLDTSDFTLSPSTPLGIDSVEGWQTYRNSEFGLEARYP